MRIGACRTALFCVCGVLGVAAAARAQQFQLQPQVQPQVQPLQLQQQPESIYAPPEAPQMEQGANEGPLTLNLTVGYWTDYVFRGIDRSESGGSEDSPNILFDGSMTFDLGRYPKLFVGVFSNIYDSDPISRFQEIRPYFGLEFTARPVTMAFGNSFYIYPDRDKFNTAELWVKMTLDDSYFFRSDDPIFSPYVLAAWDYDTYNGLYVELGIRHDFEIEDTPLMLSPVARIAYVSGNKEFRQVPPGTPNSDPAFNFAPSGGGNDSGFQHYEIGLEATYGLNELFNIPARYGKLDLKGYLFYTDGIEDKLRADTELYGGVGIGFSY